MKQNYVQKTTLSVLRKQLAVLIFILPGLFQAGLFSQITYSFTPAGATGSLGPTQSQLNTAYSSGNLNGMVTTTNGIQSWTVATTGQYKITAIGAAGGASTVNSNYAGGSGSQMRGEFTLTQGDVIQILVGQKGESKVAGAGGGGSFVVRNTTLLIAAGGGGGSTSDYPAAHSTTLTAGTNDSPGGTTPGGTNGNGGQVCNAGVNNAGGGGGYLTSGATNTVNNFGFSNGGGGTSYLGGGTGGMDYAYPNHTQGGFGGGGGATNNFVGGGGGGGYSGGAGGQQIGNCNAALNRTGGGGGGSYNSGINQVNTPSVSTGDGMVIITTACDLSVTASSSVICSGKSVTLTTNAVSNYSWSTGNTTSSVIVVSPANTTTYSVSGTSPMGCNVPAFITITVNPTPAIGITTSTTSVCPNQTAVLTATGAATYTWTGATITNGSPFSPTVTKAYTVTATAANGCTNTAMQTITVNASPTLAINGTTVICNGASTTLTVSGAASYNWNTNATTPVITVSPAAGTSYSVTGTSAFGCTATALQQVIVNSLPTISVNSGTICAGKSFTIVPGGASTYTIQGGNAVVSPASVSGYTVAGTSTAGCVSANAAVSNVTPVALPVISVNNGSVCPNNSFVIVPSGASTYSINSNSFTVSPATTASYSVTGTSSVGCVSASAAIAAVTVYSLPVLSVNSGTVCSGNPFTVTASGANTYSITGNSFTVSPTTTTSYSVTGTSSDGCPSSNTAVASVTALALPVISVNSGSICTGKSFVLVPSGAATYTISGGTTTVSPALTTSYSVTGTSAEGCVSGTAAVTTITVSALPVTTISVVQPTICAGSGGVLVAGGADTYLWNTGVLASVLSVTPATTTDYTVTGIAANGCTNTATSKQYVDPCTSINTLNTGTSVLSVYPNPNNGSFSIETANTCNISIMNAVGQLVATQQLAEGKNEVSLTAYASGIYFIRLQEGGITKSIKIIKE